MELTEFSCTNCGAALQGEEVDLRLGVARCSHCDTVFAIERSGSESASAGETYREPVPMPKGFEVQDIGEAIEIVRPWWNCSAIFLVFFCIFWDGFMLVWYGIAIAEQIWIMMLFGLIHLGVGIGLTYYTICLFVNKTTIRAGAGMMQILHGPLPWWGNREMSTSEIRQLYCTRKRHQSKNGVRYTYELNAVLQNRNKEALVTNLTDAEQALYLEQELERFLGITDKPVRGEMERG